MRLLVSVFIGLLLSLSGQAQDRVRHIRVQVVDSARLEIQYDLVNARPGDSVYFSVKSRLRGSVIPSAEFIRGDIGKNVVAGSDRRIIWDALANGYSLNEEIRVTVSVKAGPPITIARTEKPAASGTTPTKPTPDRPAVTVVPKPSGRDRKTDDAFVLPERQTAQPVDKPQPTEPATNPTQTRPVPSDAPAPVPSAQPNVPAETTAPTDSVAPRKTRYAGPAWALLSVVAPGIGNIFVQTPKPRVGFRPILTIGCYGLVAYGLLERQKAQDDYALYLEQKNSNTGEPIYQTANDHNHQYWLATRGAVVLAAADVILTFFKGVHNSQYQKQVIRRQGISLRPGLQAGQPTAVVRYSF